MRLALALVIAATTLTTARHELFDALRSGDRAALDRMLTPDFTFVHSTGVVETRDAYLAHLSKSDVELLDESVRVYGDHTAVCVSRSKVGNMNFRGTDVFVKVDGVWKLAAVQSTRLPTRPKGIDIEMPATFVGEYKLPDGRTLIVKPHDATLAGIRQKELIPIAPAEFVWFSPDSNVDMRLLFGSNTVTLRSDGVERWTATKR